MAEHPPPPKSLHNHCLQFLLGYEDVQREIENKDNAKLVGGGGGGGSKQGVLWYLRK